MDEKLKYFLYAAQTLSFKKTAEHFFVSATAVSKGVSSLENEIGVKLFSRHHNSIELSDAGRAFYENTKFLLSDYQNAINVAKGASQNQKESVIVGFSSIYEAKLLAPLLSGYLKEHPDVEIKLKHRSIEQLEQEIGAGTVDVAFTFADFQENTKIHSEVLYRGNYVLGVATDSSMLNEKPVKAAQLADQLVGIYNQYNSELAETMFVQSLEERGLSIGSVKQFESYVSLMLSVSLGKCVVFVPEIFVDGWDFPGVAFAETEPRFHTYEFVMLTGATSRETKQMVGYVGGHLDI